MFRVSTFEHFLMPLLGRATNYLHLYIILLHHWQTNIFPHVIPRTVFIRISILLLVGNVELCTTVHASICLLLYKFREHTELQHSTVQSTYPNQGILQFLEVLDIHCCQCSIDGLKLLNAQSSRYSFISHLVQSI